MNKLATVRVHGNAGPGRGREPDVGAASRRRQREPGGRGDRSRRAAGRARRRLRPLRDLDEGDRHRRLRLGRAPERLHGADRPAGRVRRRGRGAGRLDLRGSNLRPRGGRGPRGRLRREGVAGGARRRAARPAGAGRASTAPSRRTSGVTARPVGSTTSRSTTWARTDGEPDGTPSLAARPARVAPLRPQRDLRRSSAPRARASTTSAASVRSGACRTSTTCSFSARASRATRSRATGSAATLDVELGTRFAAKPLQLRSRSRSPG